MASFAPISKMCDSHYAGVIMGAMASQNTSLTIFSWNSPVTNEFPAQIASNAENASI